MMTDNIKETIKEKQKQASFTIKLNDQELMRLQNESIRSGFGEDWKAYATKKFREEVTQSLVGSPTIGIGQKGLVTGPSKQVGGDYACK